VLPTDPDHPLPQSDADVTAANLSSQASSGSPFLSTVRTPEVPAGLEGEDLELQAALQASLDRERGQLPRTRGYGGAGPSTSGASLDFPPSSLFASPPPVPPPSSRPQGQSMANPVAASMARNQAMLERVRREQEAALREHYHEEASRFGDRVDRSSSAARYEVEDEDEQLRRAIAESEAMAREQGYLQEDEEVAGTGADLSSAKDRESPHGLRQGSRVYDDENAALQAALQASLQSAPPEVDSYEISPRASSARHSSFMAASTARLRADNLGGPSERDDDELYDDDSGSDTATEETMSDAPPQPEAEDLSIEEMRRRRLARFGGPKT
jgi:Ataxin-3